MSAEKREDPCSRPCQEAGRRLVETGAEQACSFVDPLRAHLDTELSYNDKGIRIGNICKYVFSSPFFRPEPELQ